jgi:bacterial/archaeal transporter family protein
MLLFSMKSQNKIDIINLAQLLMNKWLIFALISMLFAGLTSVIAKAGLKNVSGETGLAVRTVFVFVFVWANNLLFQNLDDVKNLTKTDLTFLGISGFTTFVSWLFYYKAIKIGNVSEVALIDKGSILITLILSFIFLREPFTAKIAFGAGFILIGLIILIFK